MRGFVQIPIIVIIFLISGGLITAYTITHKNPAPQSVANQQKESSNSAKEATGSSENSNLPISKLGKSPSPKPSSSTSAVSPSPRASSSPTVSANNPPVTPNPTNTPVPTVAPSLPSMVIFLLAPSGSAMPRATGKATVDILENGFIFSARVQGNIAHLRSNTSYYVSLCRNDGSCGTISQVQTDDFGDANFSGSTTTRNGGDKIKSVTVEVAEPESNSTTITNCKYSNPPCLSAEAILP